MSEIAPPPEPSAKWVLGIARVQHIPFEANAISTVASSFWATICSGLQFLARVAEDLAQALIDHEKLSVEPDMGDTNRRVFECATEPDFALAQSRIAAGEFLRGCVQGLADGRGLVDRERLLLDDFAAADPLCRGHQARHHHAQSPPQAEGKAETSEGHGQTEQAHRIEDAAHRCFENNVRDE